MQHIHLQLFFSAGTVSAGIPGPSDVIDTASFNEILVNPESILMDDDEEEEESTSPETSPEKEPEPMEEVTTPEKEPEASPESMEEISSPEKEPEASPESMEEPAEVVKKGKDKAKEPETVKILKRYSIILVLNNQTTLEGRR